MNQRHTGEDLKGFKRQSCSVCKCEEKFNFHVPDDVWRRVVPTDYRNRVVCLSCFDSFARANDVDYSQWINDLYFAGDKAAVKFTAKSSQNL